MLLLALTPSLVAGPKEDFARGVLEEARGNDGLEWYEKALEADPDAVPLVSKVGDLRFAAGDVEGAAEVYRGFAERRPDEVGPQVAYADFLRSAAPNDDYAAKLATEVLERALNTTPNDLRIIRRLFRAYEQVGEREKSLELFDRVKAGEVSGGNPALAAADMARTLFPSDDEKVRDALDGIFRTALERQPADRVTARAASEHFRKSGRIDEAIEMLEIHTAADPSSLDLRIRTGVLMFVRERHEEGEALLQEVLKIDPRKALAHQSLAKLYRRQEKPDEARPHAAEVLKIRGGDADEFVSLADEFLEAGMPREARLLLEKGLFDHPDEPGIAVKLAVATRRDPDTRSGAARLFREAEALVGDDGPATEPEFLIEFAECLLEAGETTAAEDRLRAAIERYPREAKREQAAALRRLAGIWNAEGRNEAAARALLKRAEALEE
ncbi:MAG: tetratricopeptide repeat protein [Verrucomicrobiota bacterium]